MKTFQEILSEELSKPVPVKGSTAQIYPMEAMARAVLSNAVKGDLASIAFISTMTRVIDPEAERTHNAKMQSQGYSDFASQVFATNKETKVVIDTQAGKVFGKGKGVIQTGVTPKNVISIANAYSSKYKGSQAVKVNF